MTDKPKMPEPEIEGSVFHQEYKMAYRAPVHYTAEQMEAYAEAIQEWAYGNGYDAGCRDTEIDND